MSNLSHNQSPFDSIRHIDEQGNEFWLGRELMHPLEYPRWADFTPVVEKAKLACQNTRNDVAVHFSGLTLKTDGRPREDIKLSRYGCYLVAMNGDPRKPAIAQAQSYFAAKTYEAETQPALGAIMTQLIAQSQQMMLQTQQMLLQIAAMSQQQANQLTVVSNKVAEIEVTQEKAIASLDEIPNPEVEAEELTTRVKLNRLVRDYSAANALHFQEVWRRVYREFKDRYHIDLRQRAKNIQASGGKFKALDVCEQMGKIEELYAVAFDLLKG